MDTLRTPVALASLVAANLAPLAGIVLFGWSPASLCVLYYVDTVVGIGVVLLLVMAHVTGNEKGAPLRGWKDWAKAVAGLAVLGSIMALPLAIPLIFAFGEGVDWERLAADPGFRYAVIVQAALSVAAGVRMHRELVRRDDDDRLLAQRLLYLVARWVTLFIATITGLIALLGPTIGGFLLVAIYAGASIYFELFPDRAMRFVRGRDAPPIRYDPDLDGPQPRGERDAGKRP